MRTLVFSKRSTKRIENLLKKHGHKVVKSKPDVVVCWGGDGTLLLAENKHPGVPKLALGHSRTCKKCIYADPGKAIEKLGKRQRYIFVQKLQATIIKGKRKTKLPLAMNDVVLRNKDQMHAVRFTVKVRGKIMAKEQIGDGVVVCTDFGSTAYYQSITRRTFTGRGFGIAFNNTMDKQEPLLLGPKASASIDMDRGDGTITVDTLEKTWTMKKGDRLVVKKSSDKARIIVL